MVVGIDETGQHESPGCVDHLMLAAGRDVGADRRDPAVLDADIGDRRVMHIAVVVVDLPPAYQQLRRGYHQLNLANDCL